MAIHACDGDVLTDVTRYSEMIINPETQSWCSPTNLGACPPYHVMPDNRKIYRNDTSKFPYSAYHYYCAPGNARHLEAPVPVSLTAILGHKNWFSCCLTRFGVHMDIQRSKGMVGSEMEGLGNLTSAACPADYFYQDPDTPPGRRVWSIDLGTEIFVSDHAEIAEWSPSDFDVLLESTKS